MAKPNLMTRLLLAALLVLVIGACAVGGLQPPGGSSGGYVITAGPSPTRTETPVPGTATIAPTPTITPIPESVFMAQTLQAVNVPHFDLGSWLISSGFVTGTPPTPAPVRRPSTGQTARFHVGGDLISARLVYQNAVVNMWVESGLSVPRADVVKAADEFASKIYPTVRAVFGSELTPGIDGDVRLNVLTAFWLGPNVAGYFQPYDEQPTWVEPTSNQREIFYMSWLAYDVGSADYMSTLAHEFQHMVQYNMDRNESIWLNEGLSQVAERIAGYSNAFTHLNYLFDSRVQLNTWSPDFRQSYSNYGAGYLYLEYIREHYGDDVIKQIAQSPLDGLASVDAALQPVGTSVDATFGDWIIANYVNDPSVEGGRYGYTAESLIPVCPRTNLGEAQSQRPVTSIAQYSPQYIEMEGEGTFDISFKGDTEAQIIPSNPQGGRWMYWANVTDSSFMTLTRTFDLTSVTKATLQFSTWYDLEDGSDYGFIKVSTDGGQTWQFAQSSSMEVVDIQTNEGPHFTGGSGGGTENPLWSRETVDLTPFVGHQVMIRFEQFTDLKVTGDGWVIDNVRIPEINFQDDFEQPDDAWVADGWVRMDNIVPQNWTVAIVQFDGGTTVGKLALDGENAGAHQIVLPVNGHATIIVGAMAPITKNPAEYSLRVTGTGTMASIQPPPGILFQDDFESPCSSFSSFILPDYRYGFQDGHYEIAINVEDTYIAGSAGQEVSDAIIDVDTLQIKTNEDSTFGVLCRVMDDYNYYEVEFSNESKFRIGRVLDGFFEVILDWVDTTALATGDGSVNHIRVSCNQQTIAVIINNQAVGQVEDSSFRRGDIGFSATTYEGKDILVTFDNLVVSRP